MTLAQLLTLISNRLDDTKEPYLWSDEELTAYVNSLVNIVCETVPAIRDRTTPYLCTIPVSIGVNNYPLDPRIIYVHQAKLDLSSIPLSRISGDELRFWNDSWELVNSTPAAFMTDIELDRIHLYGNPIIADTLRLWVVRYPLFPLDYTKADTEKPEIPERLHELLIPGVTSLAYRKADAETENLVRSKADGLEWEANLEKIRKLYLKREYSPYTAVAHQAFM